MHVGSALSNRGNDGKVGAEHAQSRQRFTVHACGSDLPFVGTATPGSDVRSRGKSGEDDGAQGERHDSRRRAVTLHFSSAEDAGRSWNSAGRHPTCRCADTPVAVASCSCLSSLTPLADALTENFDEMRSRRVANRTTQGHDRDRRYPGGPRPRPGPYRLSQ
jgi:hypothetical protein